MKTLSIDVPDEVYQRAEARAAELGTTIVRELTEAVIRLGANGSVEPGAEVSTPQTLNLAQLFAALDKARNTESVANFESVRGAADEPSLDVARDRMRELFLSTKGFR